MSENAFVAAIRPNVYGSSTRGVKKSIVCTTASSSEMRQTAASSRPSWPTMSWADSTRGSPASTWRSDPAGRAVVTYRPQGVAADEVGPVEVEHAPHARLDRVHVRVGRVLRVGDPLLDGTHDDRARDEQAVRIARRDDGVPHVGGAVAPQ